MIEHLVPAFQVDVSLPAQPLRSYKKKILVAGTTGFTGSTFVLHCLECELSRNPTEDLREWFGEDHALVPKEPGVVGARALGRSPGQAAGPARVLVSDEGHSARQRVRHASFPFGSIVRQTALAYDEPTIIYPLDGDAMSLTTGEPLDTLDGEAEAVDQDCFLLVSLQSVRKGNSLAVEAAVL